jgi:hypothetical protein
MNRLRSAWLGTVVAWHAVSGCGTYRITPVDPLPDAHRTRWGSALVIAREPAGKRIATTLRRTEVFDPVAVASVDSDIPEGTAWVVRLQTADRINPVPFLSVLTLGVIPTTASGRESIGYLVAPPDREARAVRVDYDVLFVFGWLGMPLNLLPGYHVVPHPEETDEFASALRAALIREFGGGEEDAPAHVDRSPR